MRENSTEKKIELSGGKAETRSAVMKVTDPVITAKSPENSVTSDLKMSKSPDNSATLESKTSKSSESSINSTPKVSQSPENLTNSASNTSSTPKTPSSQQKSSSISGGNFPLPITPAKSPKFLGNAMLMLILIAVFVPFLWAMLFNPNEKDVTLSEFVNQLRSGTVSEIEVAGDEIRFHSRDSEVIGLVQKESNQQLLEILEAADVDLTASNIKVKNLSTGQILAELAVNVLPFVIGLVLIYFIFTRMKGGSGDMLGMGKSKARLFIKGKQDIKFDNVGGMAEAKKELEEIVDFLKYPKKYQKIGARTPKGVLISGPAGTGKTLLARAVAGEANVQFLSIAGSEFMEMLVGVGASRVRDLFATAKKMAPAIIFIDEIDVIGRVRGQGGGAGGQEEREQTLNQILVEMDGFTPNDNVVVMAATNRVDMLDPALVRPGRFDRRVQLSLPDLEERKVILKIHSKGKMIAKDVKWNVVAKNTTGFSGADLENMLNEAAIAAVQDNRDELNMADISEAAIKVKMGPSKKRIFDEYERQMTAYHEIGHAVVAHYSPNADKVSRISIVSRGSALGYTLTPPEKDSVQTTRSELLDDIKVLFGGRAVEEIVFNELTAGASNDIERATNIARTMVENLGMSKLGIMYFGPQYDQDSYSRGIMEAREISPEIKAEADKEIRKILNEAYDESKKLVNSHREELDMAAARLLEVETLDGEEFAELMKEKKASVEHQSQIKAEIKKQSGSNKKVESEIKK